MNKVKWLIVLNIVFFVGIFGLVVIKLKKEQAQAETMDRMLQIVERFQDRRNPPQKLP